MAVIGVVERGNGASDSDAKKHSAKITDETNKGGGGGHLETV